jgi:hypothetical protein
MNSLKELKEKQSISQYFLDLDLAGSTTWGSNRIYKRNLWLIGCYLSFALGVFARQIFSYNEHNIHINNAGVDYMSLLGSFAIGLALFPFALRTIMKLVTWIFQVKPLHKNKQGFNIIHLMTSYALGYFFNLIVQNIPVILSKIG